MRVAAKQCQQAFGEPRRRIDVCKAVMMNENILPKQLTDEYIAQVENLPVAAGKRQVQDAFSPPEASDKMPQGPEHLFHKPSGSRVLGRSIKHFNGHF
jgi:hypothetical protein